MSGPYTAAVKDVLLITRGHVLRPDCSHRLVLP